MAGAKGYSSYRGRVPRWKILAAVLLVLVILAAVVVLLLQRHIVYDETGTPHLELPWQTEQTESPKEEPPIENVELVIQSPEEEVEQYVVCDMSVPLDPEVWSLTIRQIRETTGKTCDAVVVTLKDSDSNVWYDSAAALSGTVQAIEDVHNVPIGAAVSPDVPWHAIARIACFRDPKVARHFVTDRGLQNKNGYIFHDGNNSQWLNPAKPFARQYLCAMAVEAAKLGFDEILLADVCYPTEGKLEQIAYGEGEKSQHILTFLQEMREALAAYGVKLSIELPENVILEGKDETAGLVLKDVVSQVDAIYANTTVNRVEELTAIVNEVGDSMLFVPKLEAYSTEVASCMIG